MTQLNKAFRLAAILKLRVCFLLVSTPHILDKVRIYMEATPFI